MGNNASHHHGSNGSTPRSRGDSSPGQQPAVGGSSSLAPPSSSLGSGSGAGSGGGSSSRNRSQSMSTPLSSTFAPASIYATLGGGSSRGGGSTSTPPPPPAAPAGPPTPPGLVDGGHLHPQGQYALRPFEHQDYSHPVVKELILNKRLAPFYRGLEDHEEEWGVDEVASALKELRGGTSRGGGKKLSEREYKEASAYKGAVECPICFLYYPPNINTSRCCQQPICTECFVQIKRAEPTVTHLESEPAACPFCMELEFGVIYEVQNIVRSAAGAGAGDADEAALVVGSPSSEDGVAVVDPRRNGETARRKSVSSKSAEVVTIDHIRPDWEDKVNAVKAAAARRASRRIIMQRVGDRLVPVGYTSSRVGGALPGGAGGELGPITTGAGGVIVDEESLAAALNGSAGGSSGRSRRSRRFGSMGGSGGGGGSQGAEDLEEMMMMEAMRLSLLEHEEQQRKEAEAKRKEEEQAKKVMERERGVGSSSSTPPNGASSTSSAAAPTTGRPRAPTVTFSDPPVPDRSAASASTRPTMGDLIDLGSMESVPQTTAPATASSTAEAPVPAHTTASSTGTSAALPAQTAKNSSFVSHRETTTDALEAGSGEASAYAQLESDDER